jgi:hypothetical protein
MDEPIRKRTEDDEQDRPLDVLPFSPERIAYWANLAETLCSI